MPRDASDTSQYPDHYAGYSMKVRGRDKARDVYSTECMDLHTNVETSKPSPKYGRMR